MKRCKMKCQIERSRRWMVNIDEGDEVDSDDDDSCLLVDSEAV